MKCLNCGTESDSDSRFCANCGSPLSQDAAQTQDEAVDNIKETTGMEAETPNSENSQSPATETVNETSKNSDTQKDNKKHNPKKLFRPRNIVFMVTGLLLIVGAIFGGNYYMRYRAAEKEMSSIESLVQNKEYSQAYDETNILKSKYNFGKFSKFADKTIEDLKNIATQRYKDGLGLIKLDNQSTFEKTSSYFNEYKATFTYSSYNKSADDLLKLIDSYEKSNDKLNEALETKKFLDSSGDILAVMEGYISEVEDLHELADSAINKGNAGALDDLISLWSYKSSYYYDMVDDIVKFEKTDAQQILFSQEEYDQFKSFIVNALLPGEAAYNYAVYGKTGDPDLVKQSWSKYIDLRPKVIDLINAKKDAVNSLLKEVDKIKQDTAALLEQIRNFESTQKTL